MRYATREEYNDKAFVLWITTIVMAELPKLWI
jgi:hypothetical protein